MSQIFISDGANSATVWDVQEERPSRRTTYDVVADSLDGYAVTEAPDGIITRHVAGRLRSREDLERIEGWLASSTELSFTGRDGVMDGPWRIYGDPPPRIVRKDGDSLDWTIDFQLWRQA